MHDFSFMTLNTLSLAELVLVVSGTTNMYPGYGIVYKNVPVFGHCRNMYPALIVVYSKSKSRSSQTGFDVASTLVFISFYNERKCDI